MQFLHCPSVYCQTDRDGTISSAFVWRIDFSSRTGASEGLQACTLEATCQCQCMYVCMSCVCMSWLERVWSSDHRINNESNCLKLQIPSHRYCAKSIFKHRIHNESNCLKLLSPSHRPGASSAFRTSFGTNGISSGPPACEAAGMTPA